VLARVGERQYVSEVITTTSAFAGVHPEARFGLGAATVVDELSIRWPSGRMTTLTGVAVDQVLTVVEE
jgi:hypothetical protein